MARIPAAELERLKAEVPVERLVEARGVALKRHGADLIGRCPFHDDREPSLVVTPEKNLWHCLGACQAGGSVIDWVMRAEGVSFRHAVELLRADVPLAAAGAPAGRSTVAKLPSPLARTADDAKLLTQVVAYYHRTLLEAPEAMAYLERRGIAQGEAIERFRLGFANRTLGYRLPQKNRKEGAALRGQLQRIGLLRPSGHEHFAGSLVIPVIDAAGAVSELYGRKITQSLRKGTPLHLYLPGPHQGVWNAAALEASPEAIVCESLIDALTFWCAGYRNVTAAYGVEGFTEEHLATLRATHTERVLIAYDRDAAGEQAAAKLAERLLAEGFDAYRIEFPKGMDANAYALKVKPAAKSLGLVIRQAAWLGRWRSPGAPVTGVVADAPATTHDTPSSEPSPTPLVAAPEPAPASNDAPPAEPELPVLPAAAQPPGPPPPVSAELSERKVVFTFGERRYRVRGLEQANGPAALKLNVLVSAPSLDGAGEALHVDTLDLYHARARGAFIRQAAVELGVRDDVIKHDLGRLLLECERLQEAQREAASPEPQTVTLGDAEREAALALLRAPDLVARIEADLARLGLVGESTNKLVAYLACLSRKLAAPLALLVQSTSAAGKSSLMEAVLALVPAEDRVHYSAMTGQSLFYLGETDLAHRVLAIAEEEGVASAAYALKLLQSEGELTIASTAKDPVTGRLSTQAYHVQGPVSLFLTSTAAELDEELLNRCLVLAVDEGRDQTRAIHRRQRERRTLRGLLAHSEREALLAVHRNAQRLLEPLSVVNPFAERLTFVDAKTRTRRDHEKYLTLIEAIALLHQHQREVKTVSHGERTVRYVEVTLDDIALANRLAHEVLGRTLDELPPQTRRLLGLLVGFVAARAEADSMQRRDVRFSRRELREATGWGDTQLKVHLARLVELEYLLVHRAERGQRFVYELLYDAEVQTPGPHLCGLIDVAALADTAKHDYDARRSGANGHRSAPGRPPVGARSGGGRGAGKGDNGKQVNELADTDEESSGKALIRPAENPPSQPPVALTARPR